MDGSNSGPRQKADFGISNIKSSVTTLLADLSDLQFAFKT
jgi:hypothetical protein